jgi:site-specific recombinase XerC
MSSLKVVPRFDWRRAGLEKARTPLARIRRTLGTARAKKMPLTTDVLQRVLHRIPDDLSGIRDCALVLVGFAGALRRSELVALDIADIVRHQKGIVLTVGRRA